MLKKVLVGTLFVALIGALVAGAVIRTSDRLNKEADAYGGQGRSGNDLAVEANAECSNVDTVAAGGNRGSSGRGVRDEALGDGNLGTGVAEVDEWITLEGTVTAADSGSMSIAAEEGTSVTVENRAWSFAQEQGFSVQAGDRVRLVGFYEDGDFEVGTIENLSSRTQVQLREESGRPLWAGRGRGGGA